MSDNQEDEKRTQNPHAWVDETVYRKFLRVRGVSETCELCGKEGAWWIDTGSQSGYVPRISAMPTIDGKAVAADTFQMPVVRAMCFNCGNVRLHGMFAFDIWKATGFQEGQILFQNGNEGNGGDENG